MKQKLIISLAFLLLIGVIFLIVRDLYVVPKVSEKNPCEYNLDKLKSIDPSVIGYKELKRFNPYLSGLSAIAIDSNSNLYIVGSKFVKIFNSNWYLTRSIKIDSSANCIALGSNNIIYLGVGNHIETYNNKGLKIKIWKGINDKGFITSIAVSADNIFVADAGNHIVLRYNSQGKLLNEIGRKDVNKGVYGFILPSMYMDVAAGQYNDIWVANTGKHELENFSYDGTLITSWGKPSMRLDGFAGCCNPVQFAILPDGCFVTYEKGLDRIKLYNQAGEFKCVVAGPKSFGGKSDFHCSFATIVNDLAVDAKGSVYAVNSVNDEIVVFERK